MKRTAAISVAIALAGAAPATAEEWQYSGALYGWLPSMTGTITTPLGEVEMEPGGGSVFEYLEGVFMGLVAAHNGKWGVTADFLYTELGKEAEPPLGVVFDDANVDLKLAMLNLKGLYRVVDTPRGFVNLTGGVRWYDISLGTELKSDLVANRNSDLSSSWADLTLGVNGYAPLSESWFVAGTADVGGFGIGSSSDLSWQAVGAVGYRFNETWSAELGYRHLSIEKDIRGSDWAIDLSGPVVGVSARF